MKSPHILNIGNVRKLKENLKGIIDDDSLDRIEVEIESNVNDLLGLAKHHYRFALGLSSPNWRHKISRFYYAAYHAQRALRLYCEGIYSTDTSDHKKIGELPDDFPERARFKNQLSILRVDRNMCDYDHTSKASDLALGTKNTLMLVERFLESVHEYLEKKGIHS